MTIPNLPAFFDMYYTKEDGRLTPDGYLYNDQMFQALNLALILINSVITSVIENTGGNTTIVNNGIKFPPFTTAEIVALEPDADNGTVWFNTTLKKLQLKTDTGVIETITSV